MRTGAVHIWALTGVKNPIFSLPYLANPSRIPLNIPSPAINRILILLHYVLHSNAGIHANKNKQMDNRSYTSETGSKYQTELECNATNEQGHDFRISISKTASCPG
jgi:hypothetical protein